MFKTLRHALLIIGIYIFVCPALQAQVSKESVAKGIDKTYQNVRIDISRKKLYTNQFTLNLKRHNLHRSGYRHYAQKLYYDWQSSSVVLRLALVRSERGNIDYQKEFLYDQSGELIYFHEKQNDQKKYPYRELRVYFSKGKLLVWNQSQQGYIKHQRIQSPTEKVKLILKEAKALREEFSKQVEKQ